MTLQPLYLAPGVDKSNSAYSDQQQFAYGSGGAEASRIGRGRYVDANWVRTLAGFPEKIGGYVQNNATAFEGAVRKLLQMDLVGSPTLIVQTDSHLYANGVDVTPPVYMITQQNISANVQTTAGSADVVITVSIPSVSGNIFVNVGSSNTIVVVGGLSISGYYPIIANSGTTITIQASEPATSNSSGSQTITIRQPNYLLGANPFATTLNSTTVVVTDSLYALAVAANPLERGTCNGEYVIFSGVVSFNGVTISGEYQVANVNPVNNTYDITVSTPATAGGSGGGSAALATYLMSTTTANLPLAYSVTAAGDMAQYGGYAVMSWTGNLLGQSQEITSVYLLGFAAGVALNRAYPLHNSPPDIEVVFVTPEKYIIALSPTEYVPNGRTLQPIASPLTTYVDWPDQSDPTAWQVTATNTAQNNLPVIGGSVWTAAVAVKDFVSLISTDECVFEMQYTGAEATVYSISIAGNNCGAVGRHAMAARGGVAYWVGNGELWTWDGAVAPLPTDDIREFFFSNLNVAAASKVVVGTHALKKEVWIFYPSGSSTENDSLLIYHIDRGVFSPGQPGAFGRSAWCDNVPNMSPLGPLSADVNGIVWQMEVGTDEVTNSGTIAIDAWITSSFVELNNGDTNLDLNGFILDTERQSGNLDLTLITQIYPEDTGTDNGPFSIAPGTSRVDTRLAGRLCAFKIESNVVGGDFRLGLCRMDVKPSGMRR